MEIDLKQVYKFLHVKITPRCRNCCYYKNGISLLLEPLSEKESIKTEESSQEK